MPSTQLTVDAVSLPVRAVWQVRRKLDHASDRAHPGLDDTCHAPRGRSACHRVPILGQRNDTGGCACRTVMYRKRVAGIMHGRCVASTCSMQMLLWLAGCSPSSFLQCSIFLFVGAPAFARVLDRTGTKPEPEPEPWILPCPAAGQVDEGSGHAGA